MPSRKLQSYLGEVLKSFATNYNSAYYHNKTRNGLNETHSWLKPLKEYTYRAKDCGLRWA